MLDVIVSGDTSGTICRRPGALNLKSGSSLSEGDFLEQAMTHKEVNDGRSERIRSAGRA